MILSVKEGEMTILHFILLLNNITDSRGPTLTLFNRLRKDVKILQTLNIKCLAAVD